MVVFGRKSKKSITLDNLLENIRKIRDLIDLRGSFSPSELRDLLKNIADAVSDLSDIERDKLARQIDEMFNEKVAIRRGWREEKVRAIRSLLKEISIYPNKKDPMIRPKILRARQLDMQIKMDEALIETMLQIRDIIVDTVRRGVEPSQAWASLIRVTSVISSFAEELTAMQEEYKEILTGITPDVSDLMQSYGVGIEKPIKEKEAEEEEIKELIERYGSE